MENNIPVTIIDGREIKTEKYWYGKIKSEKEHLQLICDKLTYGISSEYVNVDDIEEIEFLEEMKGDLEYHIEKINTLIDDIVCRVEELQDEQ